MRLSFRALSFLHYLGSEIYSISMSQQFKRILYIFAGIFIAMFLLRLVYGYTYTGKNTDGLFFQSQQFSGVSLHKNYASEKVKDMPSPGFTTQPIVKELKYEKVANVRARSTNFDEDEKQVNNLIKSFGAVIQYEENTGNKGNRNIDLLIGVAPEKFDSFYLQTQTIGETKQTAVSKTDKTNEFRKLNARKASLESSLAANNALKSKDGRIEDFIKLHEKIYEIEGELQQLGVQLGDFDSENEFCTVHFSMYESKERAVASISFATRIKVAAQWTIKYYAVFVLSIFVTVIAAWAMMKLWVLMEPIINKSGK